MSLTFDEYQKGTRKTAAYAEKEKEPLRLERFRDIPMKVLSEELHRLAGSAYMFDRIKKHIRDGEILDGGEADFERHVSKDPIKAEARRRLEYFRTQKIYVFFGLFSEVGEVAAVFQDFMTGEIDGDEMRKRLRKEIGDVLWYLSELAFELYSDEESLGRIAAENLEKLASRKRRGKIHGSGDER